MNIVEKYLLNKNNELINQQSASCFQTKSDKKYCHTFLNRISTLWFDSNVQRRQIFDLLKQNRLTCKIVPDYTARLAYMLSKHVKGCPTITEDNLILIFFILFLDVDGLKFVSFIYLVKIVYC
ncbi:unnamed protein product [Rotaria magnacalcarata]|uniref:Uncharacterized protein n=1 Tax=Rotaria magnacalcarata TaxID=392030 RepID=A0A819C999_9BILA|nr:unnamed protein product [Rotaria magnacalcarata]CAF3882477.1 unnamed protein product [Rotaria magnacalcarata]